MDKSPWKIWKVRGFSMISKSQVSQRAQCSRGTRKAIKELNLGRSCPVPSGSLGALGGLDPTKKSRWDSDAECQLNNNGQLDPNKIKRQQWTTQGSSTVSTTPPVFGIILILKLTANECLQVLTQLKGCPISVPSTGCLQRSHHVKTLQPTYDDFFWRNGLHDFLLRNLRMILTVLIIKPIIISDLRGIQPKRDPCDRHLIQIDICIYIEIYIIFIHTELVVSQISFGMQYGRFLLRCPQWCRCFSPC